MGEYIPLIHIYFLQILQVSCNPLYNSTHTEISRDSNWGHLGVLHWSILTVKLLIGGKSRGMTSSVHCCSFDVQSETGTYSSCAASLTEVKIRSAGWLYCWVELCKSQDGMNWNAGPLTAKTAPIYVFQLWIYLFPWRSSFYISIWEMREPLLHALGPAPMSLTGAVVM